jgi:hypothetical protein
MGNVCRLQMVRVSPAMKAELAEQTGASKAAHHSDGVLLGTYSSL